jgi:hypothetical protein
MSKQRPRNKSGSTLALIVALLATVGLAIILFGVKYSQELGSYQEEKSAIEAAALVAAKDLSRIVLEDPNYGFIALSDYAPVGRGTVAGDGYALPVQSINTLLATVRADMIVADYMQDPVMRSLALRDYKNAIAAQKHLVDYLTNIIDANGRGQDINGSIVSPLQDATEVYKKNAVRMEGKYAELVPGSLKLSLGYVPNSQSSRAAVLQPLSVSQVSSNQQLNGFYMPNVSVFYKNKYPVVFAALGADANLVEAKSFQVDLGVAASVPTVVKVQAQEVYHDNDVHGPATHTVSIAAAAEAGSIIDRRPHPGALTLTFLNGPITEIQTLGDIFKQGQIASDPTDLLQTPLNGDYPDSPLSPFSISLLPGASPTHPQFSNLISVGFYDWLRRAGPNLNISQLMSILTTPLNYSGNGPQVHFFEVQTDGSIKYTVQSASLANLVISQHQWGAISGLGLDSAAKKNMNSTIYYDLQLTDFTYQPGRINGGKHGGEPLSYPGLMKPNPNAKNSLVQTLLENSQWMYRSFLTNSGADSVRPTYNNSGIAFDFTFRLRQNPN